MPKQQKQALSVKTVSHPKSRKAMRMMKNTQRQAVKEKSKMATYIKQNIVGEKLLWFKERLPSDLTVCSTEIVNTLLKSYLSRFNDELEQIQLKHSIGQRKGRQHASREDTILFTKKRELEEYNTCGLEVPNLLDAGQVQLLREWDGELRFIQQFKLTRIGRKHLQAINEDEVESNSAEVKENQSSMELSAVQTSSSDPPCDVLLDNSSDVKMKGSVME